MFVLLFIAGAFVLGLTLNVSQNLSRVVSQVPWYLGELAVSLLVEVGATFLCLLMLPSVVPRKLLLFEHEWRIKYWSWRSTVYDWSDMLEVERATLVGVLLRGRWLTIPISWSPFGRGLYIRVGRHLGFFLRTQDDEETLAVIQSLKAAAEANAEPSPSGQSPEVDSESAGAPEVQRLDEPG